MSVDSRVDALLKAKSLDQAQLACSDLIDGVLDGGSAISDGAPDLLEALIETSGEGPYYAYVLAVLVASARWLGAWSRIPEAQHLDELVSSGVQAERACSVTLTQFAARTAQRELPKAPEARSLTYRLWGMLAENAPQKLLQAIERDTDVRAAASAVEGLVVALARDPAITVGDPLVRRLRAVIADGSTVYRQRASLAIHDWVGVDLDTNRRRVEELLGHQLLGSDPTPYWPSELIG